MQRIQYHRESSSPSLPSAATQHRRPLRRASSGGNSASSSSSSPVAKAVTPPGFGGTPLEQWMALRMSRETENYESERGYISPVERAEVSRAVYGILRDNLPPSLESATGKDDLLSIADAIESKLHAAAPSPRAYGALSTLEFRIAALATAVLIHSDKGKEEAGGNISETCAKLSAAARNSLVYCVMVLVSFERRNLDDMKKMQTRRRATSDKNEAGLRTVGSSYCQGTATQRMSQLEKYESMGALCGLAGSDMNLGKGYSYVNVQMQTNDSFAPRSPPSA